MNAVPGLPLLPVSDSFAEVSRDSNQLQVHLHPRLAADSAQGATLI